MGKTEFHPKTMSDIGQQNKATLNNYAGTQDGLLAGAAVFH
jgi:hypothetical protein